MRKWERGKERNNRRRKRGRRRRRRGECMIKKRGEERRIWKRDKCRWKGFENQLSFLTLDFTL